MLAVTRQQVDAALDALGIASGDGLLVHAAIQFLGRPQGGVALYFDALWACIQPGTLAVPAFNFAFARGEPYDPLTTHSAGMGAFAEYVRQLPAAHRTPHPLQSLAVTGRWADDLADRDTPSAFDPGSAFERMLELDFKLLLLGADVNAASIIHYSEQRLPVPYRAWKTFTGQVRTPQGWQEKSCRFFARDLDLDPRLDLHPVQQALAARGQWRSVPLNYGKVAGCRLVDFVSAADDLLAADPWALVSNRETISQAGRS